MALSHQELRMREVPADSVVEESPAPEHPEPPPRPERSKRITVTARTRTVRLFTYPSHGDHYMASDLNRDIMANPSLGFADF